MTEAECSATDIRNTRPELREHFSTPRDQDSIGWCYGFGAADLLTAEVGRPVSAAHVSSIYNNQIRRNPVFRFGYEIQERFMSGDNYSQDVYESGLEDKAIQWAMNAGTVCSESQFPFDQRHTNETLLMIRRLQQVKDALRSNQSSVDMMCANFSSLFPSISLTDAQTRDVVTSLLEDDINIALEKIIRTQCTTNPISLPRKPVLSIRKPSLRSNKLSEYKNLLNNTLNSGKPVALGYNTTSITNIPGGAHVSVIIARRWNGSSCEYKVRNSWGRTCEPYKIGIECDAREGSFWINDERMYEISSNFTAIP